MHVCIVSPSFPSNRPQLFPGIERFTEGLAKGFAKVGSRVTILTILRGKDISHETWNGCEIFRLRNTNWYTGRLGYLFAFDLLSFAWNVLRHAHLLSGADLAIFNMQFPFVAELSARAHIGKTAIVLHHKHPYLPLSRLLTAPFADVLVKIGQPDFIVVGSMFSAATFGNLLRLDRAAFTIIPWGVDQCESAFPREMEKSRSVTNNRRTLLYVGTADKRKNMDLLLQSFSQVLRSHQDAKLIIVGPGHRTTKKLATKLGLDEKVVFGGVVTDTELARYYETADIFVSASTTEGFGLVLGEAMAHGMPIVAFRAASLPEVVENGGILVDPYDVGALSRSICSLLQDTESYQRLSSNAMRRAGALTWENSARRILELIRARGSGS